jgi:hypothetical protein
MNKWIGAALCAALCFAAPHGAHALDVNGSLPAHFSLPDTTLPDSDAARVGTGMSGIPCMDPDAVRSAQTGECEFSVERRRDRIAYALSQCNKLPSWLGVLMCRWDVH